MSHPLTDFAYGNRAAPYVGRFDYGGQCLVMPVRCKTQFATPRNGYVIHRPTAVAAIFSDGALQYAARWHHGSGCLDVVLLPDSDEAGQICKRCTLAVQGPCVYRCYSATGELLYIGYTINRGSRMSGHASSSPWWSEVAEVKYQDFPTARAARRAEGRAIKAERPSRNKPERQRHIPVGVS